MDDMLFPNINNGSHDYLYMKGVTQPKPKENLHSAVPLKSTELCRVFQLIVLVLFATNFTVLIHSHRSHNISFRCSD